MNNHASSRVIVGLSGGVDSAVAALLLQEQGYAVEGLFMENWEDDEAETYCTAAQDFQDARQVCEQLGIPLHKANFTAAYREHVFHYFLDEYAAGRTPNPDVLCNSEIKFKAFLDHALRLGADYIATGHYARTWRTGNEVKLLRACDESKDQTYFLHAVAQAALARTLFPVGALLKNEVRRRARQAGFTNHARKDSTGICFIGERKFSNFLGKYLPAQPGRMETPEGTLVGTHRGLMYYTLGQRQGLGIGGRRDAAETPWYVAAKDSKRNVLIVVQGHEHPMLMRQSLIADKLHWVSAAPSAPAFDCTARCRYRQADQPCHVTFPDAHRCRVEFTVSKRALTPGQYVVFYRGDECLGGGVIGEVGEAIMKNAMTASLRTRSVA